MMRNIDGASTAPWIERIDERMKRRLRSTGQSVFVSIEDLEQAIGERASTRILAVADRTVVEAARDVDALQRLLQSQQVQWFDKIEPNPTLELAEQVANLARQWKAHQVLALGGGSALDLAKLAALGANDPQWSQRVREQQAVDDLQPLPIVAVPTTAGSGSEATPFAVVYVGMEKRSVAHPRLRPREVVLDPRLVALMPPRLAAVTGLDALAQSMESYWAVESTGESRSDASLALERIVEILLPSVLDPTYDLRAEMMVAAHLAGQAIGVGKTTAAHALSYHLTKRWGVPHGLAVALTLGHIAAWNAQVTKADCLDARGVEHVREQVGRAAAVVNVDPDEMPPWIQRLLRRLDLPSSLSEIGMTSENLDELARSVDPVRLNNNPRRLTFDQLQDLVGRAF